MVVTRRPLLCLDANASIDIGTVMDLRRQGKSLHRQVEAIDQAWEGVRNSVPYDEATKDHVTKLLDKRHEQLRGTDQFLNAATGRSCIRLPEFAKIEHLRVRQDVLPPYRIEPITDAAHRISLDVFSDTKLSLQDSAILASAIAMRADALVSNDEDFKKAFNTGVGSTALRMLGRPLYLLDHRLQGQGEDAAPTLYAMVLNSLLSYYSNSKGPNAAKHPRFGHPLWVDRRGGEGDWYLAYRQPLVEDMAPYLVPGQDSLSIIDERSWTVCEIGSVYFHHKTLPKGVTNEFIGWLQGQPREQHFRLPTERTAGFVDVSIQLDGLPLAWEHWNPSRGNRAESKRKAPLSARGVIETTAKPPPTSVTN